MEHERKPPAPNVADAPLEPSAEDDKKKPHRHTEDDRVRSPNTRSREEIRETTIPRKDN